MAKRSESSELIEEIESAAERMARWIADHALLAGSVVGVVLAGAAAWGGYQSWSQGREAAASNALDQVRSDYRAALGVAPGSFREPELANPAAAAAIREEYLERFDAVAREHGGTVAGALATLDRIRLLEVLGRAEEGESAWQGALEAADDEPGLAGVILQRRAGALEAEGRWAEAAAAHEAAGAHAAYPLRAWALADAARCRAAAGEPDAALALYERALAIDPDLPLPDHMRAQLRELRARAAAGPRARRPTLPAHVR